jgi:hypothetical protein
MAVRAVNDAASDVDIMINEISACDVVNLQVVRFSPTQVPEPSIEVFAADSQQEVREPAVSHVVALNSSAGHCSSHRPCAMWEVTLPRSSGQSSPTDSGLGSEVLDFRAVLLQVTGQDIGRDLLLVSRILPEGHITKWNKEQPEAAVQEGDFILKVDGVEIVTEMEEYMLQVGPSGSSLTLQLARPAPHFNVRLDMRADGRSLEPTRRSLGLGLAFENSQPGSPHHIFVTKVVPKESVAAYNSSQAAAGHWDTLVFPGMRLSSVNGIDDSDAMMKAIRTCDELELHFHRMSAMTFFSSPPSTPKKPRPKKQKVQQKSQKVEAAVSCPEHVWEVVFPRGTDQQSAAEVGLGFSILDFSAKCQHEYGISISSEVLLVADVCSWGQVSAWNAQHPESAVRDGDRILFVNGETAAEEMRDRLLHSTETLHLRVSRPPPVFNVVLEKQGRSFGFSFKRILGSHSSFLGIAAVLTEGVAAAYNAAQGAAGSWDRLMLPMMAVSAVNGISGANEMLEVLKKADKVDLTVVRSPPCQADQPDAQQTPEAVVKPKANQNIDAPSVVSSSTSTLAPEPASAMGKPKAEKNIHVPGVGSSTTQPLPPDLALWEVMLDTDIIWQQSDALGCELVDFRAKCLKLLDIDIGRDVLSVSKMKQDSRIAVWNAQEPHAEVRVGDFILAVNGSSDVGAMQTQLQTYDGTSCLTVRLGRPSWCFHARLERTGCALGLGFRNPRGSPAQHLFVTDVLADGAVSQYNSAQQAAGHWDRLVLPEMIVRAVNNIEGDFDLMVKALSTSPVVELQVQRSGAPSPPPPSSWEVLLHRMQ